jgi:Rad3-related DNA helicase
MQNTENTKNYSKFFPYSSIRDAQTEAIDFVLKAFLDEGKKFVILEAGTGVGKSAIGLTVARYLNYSMPLLIDGFTDGGYFLTTQKILQEQYMKDFGSPNGKMKSIKSSSNYICKFNKANTCADSLRALKVTDKSSRFFKACAYGCVYKKAKEDFIASKEGVTNFAYFLAETQYAGKLIPKNVLVIDEAHNADLELSKFIEIAVTERFAKQALKLSMPNISTQHQAIKWVKEVYEPKLVSHLKHVKSILGKYVDLKDKLKEFTTFAKRYELLDKHACKLHRFLKIYDSENWIVNIVPAEGRSGRRLEFKPVDVAPYSEEMLFRLGHKILMMSATILDKDGYCKLLGIPREEVAFVSIPSPFPEENKPILFSPVGSMSSKNIDQTLPVMAQAIKEILKEHAKEKGIIHCHSYKVASFLKKKLRSSRILIHDSSNRDEILKKHISSSKPTVLLSPSMTEGVDLKDDSSRFQVLCKIPYPYLGDKLIRKRMNKWKWWYPLQTAKKIVQSVGRSIRSDEDYAVTYILDKDWDRFYSRNRDIFPEDFRKCLK